MNLYSGDPYWLVKNGYRQTYPTLTKDISCDVAVIGGGITGALISYYLQLNGINVVVADRRHIGFGSTCASTALLQYEIDMPLTDLRKIAGEKNANDSYMLCLRAIHELQRIADKIPDCKFESKKSLYIASRPSHVSKLEKEFKARREIGINIRLLDPQQIKNMTGLNAPAALFSNDAAQMDPFLFTQGLFEQVCSKGVKAFDLTEIKKIREHASGAKLTCANGSVISCKKFVFANGYESQADEKEKLVELNSTYVIISKPLKSSDVRNLKPLIWESDRPYLYMRTTSDNRIIVGGKDESFYDPKERDELIKSKSLSLKKAFQKKFPAIPFETDFSWAGTFANTKDGLPYIGQNGRYRHAYYALGFGGNGIVFSQVAGEMIAANIKTGKMIHPAFSFHRKMA